MNRTDHKALPLVVGLLAATVVLTIVHFLLDAGSAREAPRWILLTATVTGFATVLVSVLGTSRK